MKLSIKNILTKKNENAIMNERYGGLAQLGEHLPYKQGVSGSSPLTSTI